MVLLGGKDTFFWQSEPSFSHLLPDGFPVYCEDRLRTVVASMLHPSARLLFFAVGCTTKQQHPRVCVLDCADANRREVAYCLRENKGLAM